MPLVITFAQVLPVSTQLDRAVGEVVGKGEGDAGDSYRWRIIAFNSFIPSSIPCIRISIACIIWISLASIFATRALIPSSIPSIRTSQDMVGDAKGNAVGEVVGNVVGKVEGEVVGNVVGKVEGEAVGKVVGATVGETVGKLEGRGVPGGETGGDGG